MDIAIPSRGRANDQPTLRALVHAGLHCHLVVGSSDFSSYEKYEGEYVKVIATPPEIAGIGPTRQWIVENLGDSDHICMCDDDLAFFKRRSDERQLLRDISAEELRYGFDSMSRWLEDYALVGFASREGANRNIDPVVFNTRILRVLGYNRRMLELANARFDDIEFMEDFHVALRLLENGHTNVILNEYAHNQRGSNASGGCSIYRSPEAQADAANCLRDMHPNSVKVVEKTTKTAWGGGTRTDVIVQWKRAYEQSK